MVVHKRMSLFDAPEGSYLVHSCNTAGMWGAGIALEFKKRFPHAFAVYERACQGNSKFALGKSWSIPDGKYTITCLQTSSGYGKNKDSKEDILKHTELALHSFLSYIIAEGMGNTNNRRKPIYSNKFNSGLFAIPWGETEAILIKLTGEYGVDWIVCDV